MSDTQDAERHEFQAEVARLLHLMVHSVYSEKEVFLRELISNAADACDKLRYAAITQPDLAGDDTRFRVEISPDPEARILTIADNGIGMDKADLVENLGTIARSGTEKFVREMSGEKADMSLIGQFGVGFYSAFMVATQVEVVSRKAGTPDTWVWRSDGSGAFTVEPADEAAAAALIAERGTAIRLSIGESDTEYLEAQRLRHVVKTYSDHIQLPVVLWTRNEDGTRDEETINSASALWTRPKSEITEDRYREFYQYVAHAFDAPWKTIHYRAEGRHEYHVLLFVPTEKPMDLFDPERSGRIKLYVNRVYITDKAPLLPGYLRFVRGVVDSADMPLNISREMLQNNPIVASIKTALTKRVLNELSKAAEKEPEAFASFWETFGPVLKEGIYEDFERRDDLLKLARFRTTKSGDGWRSLADYLADMKENQTAIYYIAGERREAVERSPQLEGFKSRDVEVLLLSDPVDSFWTTAVQGFEGKPFKSVTRGAADLDAIPKTAQGDDGAEETAAAAPEAAVGTLIAAIKQTLGEDVEDVRKSDRLTDSAVCLVAGENAMDMAMERILAASGQLQGGGRRVLEVNPKHPLIARLAQRAGEGVTPEIEDAARLLYDQARIQEGETVDDPTGFARRLSGMLMKGL